MRVLEEMTVLSHVCWAGGEVSKRKKIAEIVQSAQLALDETTALFIYIDRRK